MSDKMQTVTLTINLGDDAHPDEVNRATTQLYTQLRQSDAASVEKVRGETTEAGAKGDPITIGAIVLGVSVAVAPEIVKIVHNWLARRRLETVAVKIKLGDNAIEFPAPASASPDEIEALANRFAALLKKHGDGEDPKPE